MATIRTVGARTSAAPWNPTASATSGGQGSSASYCTDAAGGPRFNGLRSHRESPNPAAGLLLAAGIVADRQSRAMSGAVRRIHVKIHVTHTLAHELLRYAQR